jgi:preprotein translocase subunit SecE
MDTKINTTTSTSNKDTLKWSGVAVVLCISMFGFYYFAEHSLLMRVIILLSAVGVATFLAFQTEKGQNTWIFMRASHTEVRKVVWPTRQETLQTTGIIILMVILVALIIWLLDTTLMWLVRLITGQGD